MPQLHKNRHTDFATGKFDVTGHIKLRNLITIFIPSFCNSNFVFKLPVFFFMFLEIESSKKQAEMDRKAIDDLVRERDILNKNLLKVNIRVADITYSTSISHILS